MLNEYPVAIICLGNRFVVGDDIGGRAYDRLARMALPPGVELIDGGLCGLDLLGLLEGRRRVVFADTLAIELSGERIEVLDAETVARQATHYGHSAGLPYLLQMLPLACLPPWPDMTLVGARSAVDEATLLRLTELCLEIAVHGRQ